MKIPFFRNKITDEEKKAITDVLDSGWLVMGPKTEEFEIAFAKYVGGKYAIFVDSCTAALFLSIAYIKKDLSHVPEWEDRTPINVPSFTFTASAEAIVNNGIPVRFVDVDLDTFCVEKSEGWTLPVHLTGNRSSVEAPIYDSAHRIEKNGYKGGLECYSFYATKNMTTIQGGMIVTDIKQAYEWLKMARDHGLNAGTKERYTRKYIQYDVEFVGYRFKADDVRAAMGLVQLSKLPMNTHKRNKIVKSYNEAFGYKRTGNHLYPLFVRDREVFVQEMINAGVQCAIHYKPLHEMTAYKKFRADKLPNTEWLGKHVVSVPMFPEMTDEEVGYVINEVLKTGQLIR